jgi:hypothetical protein
MPAHTVTPEPKPFHIQLRALIRKHLHGDLELAAETLDVSMFTLKGWLNGTKIPGFENQAGSLRKLRSLEQVS